jgi:hypothetical protein
MPNTYYHELSGFTAAAQPPVWGNSLNAVTSTGDTLPKKRRRHQRGKIIQLRNADAIHSTYRTDLFHVVS